VGLAAIKALAEVLVKPIAAVSLLEAVAVASGLQGKVVAALDAGRKLVYAGEYGISFADVFRVSERLLTRGELLELAHRINPACSVVTPDSAVAESLSGAAATIRIVEMPRADVVARLGWRKILSGDFVTPEQLEANYLGRSDSEIFSKPAC
jgi:tRNA A37 threonylcarbamoyladenosine modification protein TsaB